MIKLPQLQETWKDELGLGEWKRADASRALCFAQDLHHSEPHLHRRRAILSRHPHLVHLYGTAPSSFLIACLTSANQLLLAHIVVSRQMGVLATTMIGLVVGGTLTALVGVLVHEACHNLIHPRPAINRIAGMIANTCMIVPVAASFRRYHLEHHTWQGVSGKDPDLPLSWEIRLIRGNALMKALWVSMYPIMYAVRGLIVGKGSMSYWELINLVFMIIVDGILYRAIGAKGFAYLAVSVWFGYSFHPAAAHFIQEHYTFASGQETYSYYGPMNWLMMNIGLHNEHHDFVKIPWTRAWALRELASEFYGPPLQCFKSWTSVHWRFLTDRTLGPACRVERSSQVHWKDRKQRAPGCK